MIPDYNHDGKIDKYDREMEQIMLEEDEGAMKEQEKHGSGTADAWVFIIVIGVMVVVFL